MLTHRIILPNTLTFEWPDRDARRGLSYSKAQWPENIGLDGIDAMVNAVKRVTSATTSKASIKHAINAMKNTFKFTETLDQLFPPEDWDDFTYQHFIWTLENTNIKYESRVHQWKDIEKFYKELKSLKFMPSDALIPSAKVRGGCVDDSVPPVTQGMKNAKVPQNLTEVLPKTILSASGLDLGDDEYLDKLESKIRLANDAILDCLVDYWNSMSKSHDLGKALLDKVSEAQYEAVLKSKNFVANGKHLANPETENGISWFLASIKYHIVHTPSFKAVTHKCMMGIPFLRSYVTFPENYEKIKQKLHQLAGDESRPIDHRGVVNELIARLLGLLSSKDCAVACAILTIENPSFNSSSVANCDLYTQNGKFYLRARDGIDRIVFSVSKPRAGTRKVSALSNLSLRVITDTIGSTQCLRTRQKMLRQSNWRRLFLCVSQYKIGSGGINIVSRLNCSTGLTVFDEYEDKLKECNVDREEFNLSTFRSTQAVLDFLIHGSLQHVSELLNNSISTVKLHYIPVWMLVRWMERSLRKVQQMLIALATEGSAWQLEASDFNNSAELIRFIRILLKNTEHGDALSEMIRNKLGKYADNKTTAMTAFKEAEVLVNLDPHYLGVLYAYNEIAESTTSNDADSYVGKNEKITSLVILLHKAYSVSKANLTAAEIAIVDKMAGDSLSQFQKNHLAAVDLSKKYVQAYVRITPQSDMPR